MANYTTPTDVRREAGFIGNTNINDTTDILPEINRAHSLVLGVVATNYKASNLTTSNIDFVDSPAEALLESAELCIATGYLLLREFQLEGDASSDVGQKHLDKGMAILESISGETPAVRLLDINYDEFARNSKSTSGTITYTGTDTCNDDGSLYFSKCDTY